MNRPSSVKQLLSIAAILALCYPLAGSKKPTVLETIRQSGTLEVLSRNGPTTFYQGPHGLEGFEYSLASAFAEHLGVELRIRNENNLRVLLDSVGTERGHIGASGLTVTPKRQRQVRFGPAYLDVTQQLLYNSNRPEPESLEDLAGGKLVVIANSAHAERLRELQAEHPSLRWQERTGLEMLDLVEMVHSGKVDYAVVDSNAYAINRHIYPRARVAFDISEPQQLAWAFPKRRDQSLYNAAEDFFAQLKASGKLAQIRQQHFDNNSMNRGGALLFANRIETRLSKWKPYLQAASKAHNLDWRLLAAISYQESHWNSRARSRTGVRGLMMLTQVTAREVGVANRVDPQQSIQGGAQYFKAIFDRIPEDIQGRDRTWMALAAYNVGMSHLEDARILTEHGGDNPDEWDDVKQYLPLLAKRKYYQHLDHGYARGWEPVEYVKKIRHFYSILSWHELMENRRLAADRAAEELQPVKASMTDRISLAL